MNRSITLPTISRATREMLRWIGQGGVASREQLRRRWWDGGQPRSISRQLERLVRGGYLLAQSWHLGRQPLMIYALTPQSARTLSVTVPDVYIGWPSRREIPHLILGQAVRLLLEEQLSHTGGVLIAWRSDRILRHRAGNSTAAIPDAEADLCRTADGGIETVEVEIDGQYYGRMLAQKAAHYGAHTRPILWACRPARAALVGASISPYPNITLIVVPDEGYI